MADRDIEDLLESDDELPNSYDEIPHIPAYLNDNRFDSSGECEEDDYDSNSDDNGTNGNAALYGVSSYPDSEPDTKRIDFKHKDCIDDTRNYDLEKKRFIRKGVLNKQDIFCLKCVANLSTEKTTLWFIDFLTRKDMHSKYTFLMSCLAIEALMEELPKEHKVKDATTKNIVEITATY